MLQCNITRQPDECDRGQRIPTQLAGAGRRVWGKNYPQPQLILCISAHWLTRGWWLTGMDKPKTIHDFGGFPQACSTSNTRHRALQPLQQISQRMRHPRSGWT
jgi:hypothetical protein